MLLAHSPAAEREGAGHDSIASLLSPSSSSLLPFSLPSPSLSLSCPSLSSLQTFASLGWEKNCGVFEREQQTVGSLDLSTVDMAGHYR